MTECSKCGDCCEAITLGHALADIQMWSAWRPWRRFGRSHWTFWKNWIASRLFRVLHGCLTNFDFVATHWHLLPGAQEFYSCDMFNATTRLCEARDERPDVCRGYPWYGKDPVEARTIPLTSRRCAYWADVPIEQRPHDLTFAV